MYVAPALRGRGVGAMLIEAVIAYARPRLSVLLLKVRAGNTVARGLYGRLGFTTYGLERKALRIDGTDYDDELMALDLDD